ncbi:unnamed protein product [Chondrus crispus]|uniref:Uncharacterized protein n=1 Tax=Chondrus crispus TaxID=2769 RepID=R7Q8C0_CHOCR|nr:unnamed protein product [Chondrus crispus]CDF33730.1 unnamed protein product [Chondrus crispus]|eukprot:XP_005713549.1 unnamed protein product [Chondrus crispus]
MLTNNPRCWMHVKAICMSWRSYTCRFELRSRGYLMRSFETVGQIAGRLSGGQLSAVVVLLCTRLCIGIFELVCRPGSPCSSRGRIHRRLSKFWFINRDIGSPLGCC